MLDLAPGISIADELAEFTFSSSSGPGGQNVNKRATRCSLRIALSSLPINAGHRERLSRLGSYYVTDAGDLLINCDEYRSQERNKSGCLDRLRELLISTARPPKQRRPTRPSRGSRERRIVAKKIRGDIKRTRRADHD